MINISDEELMKISALKNQCGYDIDNCNDIEFLRSLVKRSMTKMKNDLIAYDEEHKLFMFQKDSYVFIHQDDDGVYLYDLRNNHYFIANENQEELEKYLGVYYN